MSTASASPFLVGVRDLERRPGEMREENFTAVTPERMGEGLVAVPAGASLDIDLRLESLHEGILASIDVEATASGVCGRCLRELELPVQVEIRELFAYPSDEACEYEVHDDHVDCEPLIRDAVVLSLPFQPVCRPDCPGLDPETGVPLTDDQARDRSAPVDPRWAALAEFRASDDGSGRPGPQEEK